MSDPATIVNFFQNFIYVIIVINWCETGNVGLISHHVNWTNFEDLLLIGYLL